MRTEIEKLYLEAEADIRNNNYHDGFEKHQSIILEEPDFAPSHNSLGWLYKTQFDNYDKAIVHLKEAIRVNPLYPHPYFHLVSIYVELEEAAQLKNLLDKCLNVITIDKAWVYYRFGVIEEMNKNYEAAIKKYKEAILVSLNNDKINDYKQDIERCVTKIETQKEIGKK